MHTEDKIIKISVDYQEYWQHLDSAGLCTHDLTTVVLNEIMKADSSNEDFLHKLHPIKDSLANELLEI